MTHKFSRQLLLVVLLGGLCLIKTAVLASHTEGNRLQIQNNWPALLYMYQQDAGLHVNTSIFPANLSVMLSASPLLNGIQSAPQSGCRIPK